MGEFRKDKHPKKTSWWVIQTLGSTNRWYKELSSHWWSTQFQYGQIHNYTSESLDYKKKSHTIGGKWDSCCSSCCEYSLQKLYSTPPMAGYHLLVEPRVRIAYCEIFLGCFSFLNSPISFVPKFNTSLETNNSCQDIASSGGFKFVVMVHWKLYRHSRL